MAIGDQIGAQAGVAQSLATNAGPVSTTGAPIMPGKSPGPGVAGGFTPTAGWYITGAIVVGVALANTQAGVFVLGILGLALIYQFSLLLQHK
jgi:hypothetical protein